MLIEDKVNYYDCLLSKLYMHIMYMYIKTSFHNVFLFVEII